MFLNIVFDAQRINFSIIFAAVILKTIFLP